MSQSKSIIEGCKVRFNLSVLNRRAKKRFRNIFGSLNSERNAIDIMPIDESVRDHIQNLSTSKEHRPVCWVRIYDNKGRLRGVVDTALIRIS